MQSPAFLNCLSENETKMESDENDQLESHLKDDETLEKLGKLIFKINSPY